MLPYPPIITNALLSILIYPLERQFRWYIRDISEGIQWSIPTPNKFNTIHRFQNQLKIPIHQKTTRELGTKKTHGNVALTAFLSLYSQFPPGFVPLSNILTSKPCSTNVAACRRPVGPPPMTATRFISCSNLKYLSPCPSAFAFGSV